MYCSLDLQTYDRDGIDYNIVQVEGVKCRGPVPNLNNDYVVCLGTAMTFGRYVEKPYPRLIGALNFGYGRLDIDKLSYSPPHVGLIKKASSIIVQFSPRACYYNGLIDFVNQFTTSKTLLVFREIQQDLVALSKIIDKFERVIYVDGGSINRWYPSQSTHNRAAEVLLS